MNRSTVSFGQKHFLITTTDEDPRRKQNSSSVRHVPALAVTHDKLQFLNQNSYPNSFSNGNNLERQLVELQKGIKERDSKIRDLTFRQVAMQKQMME